MNDTSTSAGMILGLVAAKAGSARFPAKNNFPYRGSPLFWHAVRPLLDAQFVTDVRVITNDPGIESYTTDREVGVIHYPIHAIDNHTAPIHDIWRYAYQFMDGRYEMVVTILANCPGHTAIGVDAAIRLMRQGKFWQVLSFGDTGEENGLRVLAPHVIASGANPACHLGAVHSEAFEVHHEEDLRPV